jgi:type VI secretion system protein
VRGPSLLARIRKPELSTVRRTISDREMRDSILDHLKMMVSTRQGTMLTAPDYGICDVSEMVHAFPDAIAMMARSIRHTIQNYEPRLTNVQVKHIPNDTGDLTLRYEVAATVVVDGHKTGVKFQTALDPSRKLTIK